jgi:hypothetical protein
MAYLPLTSTGVFADVLSRYPQILEILLANTYGKIWMVGGSVANIILDRIRNPDHSHNFNYWNLYSLGEFPFRDFDFIVEEFRTDFKVLPGWEKRVNTFGGIKLLRKSPFREQSVTIDIWKLRKHGPCRRHNLPYTIENVLRLTPLTIQSIAVDVQEGRVIGDAGANAILSRTVAVNHVQEAQNYSRVYRTTVEEYVTRKAREYDFTPILP